jgi:hypothetical protein
MATVDEQLKADLGITRIELEGLCAMWLMGVEADVMAKELGVPKNVLRWWLIMARNTELVEREGGNMPPST